MKFSILFKRVLPVAFISGIILISFQNCAKPMALTGNDPTIASNTGSPGSSGSIGTIDQDPFLPVARTPDNGAGTAPRLPSLGDPSNNEVIPKCFAIIGAQYIARKDPSADPLLYVYVSLFHYTTNSSGTLNYSFVDHSKAKLIFTHSKVDYEYNFQTEDSLLQESELIVPHSVYSGMGNPKVSGFFSGKLFSDLPLPYCDL